jgi:hypothetical protein
MLELAHMATRALMRAWLVDVMSELATAPRPLDEPRAHASGVDPDRVLVFGNGIASGWGVASHDLAIPGELARSLANLTGRGADVELLADIALRADTARQALHGRRLSIYDAIVVFMGASDALAHTPRAEWRASMGALIDVLLDETPASARILIVAVQPIRPVPPFNNFLGRVANAHARVLNGITMELCAGRRRVRYLALPPAEEPATQRLGTPERYGFWARHLARQLAPSLSAEAATATDRANPRRERMLPQSDEDRYRAIEELGILNEERDARIDQVVENARALFGTRGAAFTLVARDHQWNKSVAGFDARRVPLEMSICAVTIQQAAPLIVSDTRTDIRFSPDSPTAFYAGYPIESPDGQRIGALCVFDLEPRSADTVDVAMLRDLALQVQREMWRYWPDSPALSKTQDILP